MTKQGHVGPLLATLRELDDATRRRVDAHLATCAECRATQAAYARQDALLSGLPIMPASPRLAAVVRARIAPPARRTLRPAWLGRAAAILAAVAVIAAVSASTVAVSAQALPGDLLYPVKRTVEQVALTVLSVPQQQGAFEDALAERRRFEARQVLELKRDVPVEFAGALQQTDDGGWAVGGIPVALDALALETAGVSAGDAVTISGETQRGELRVLKVNRERRRNEKALPAATPSAASTLTSTPAPTATTTADEAGARPGATPTPAATATPTEPAVTAPTATEPAATPTVPTFPSPTASPEPPFPRRTPPAPRRTDPPTVAAPTPTDTPDRPGRPRAPLPTDTRQPRPTLPNATLVAPSPTPAATDAPPATPTREAPPAPTGTPHRPRTPLPSPPPWPTRRR